MELSSYISMISSLDDEKLDRKDGLALQKMLESDQSLYALVQTRV